MSDSDNEIRIVNTPSPRSKKLTKEEKQIIINALEQGKTQREIAKLVNCTHSAVSKVAKKFRERGNVDRQKGSGRPSKVTPEIKTFLENKLNEVL